MFEAGEIPPSQLMSLNLRNWYDYKQIKQFLIHNNYKLVGTGSYAEVWKSKTSDRVVKFSTEEDECWVRFVKWVQKTPGNKYLPKIYSFRSYRVEDQLMFIATLEALEDRTKYFTKMFRSTFNDTSEIAFWTWYMINIEDSHTSAIEHFIKRHMDLIKQSHEFDNVIDNSKMLQRALMLKAKKHEFVKLANYLKNKTTSGCFFDLHSENVMYRPSTDCLVIVDPFAPKYN